MKYKVGDKVRCKSKEDLIQEGYISARNNDNLSQIYCTYMYVMYKNYGNKVVTIDCIIGTYYKIKEDNHYYNWSDDMFKHALETTPCGNKYFTL